VLNLINNMAEKQFLKKRAYEFWQRADEDFQKGRYNLCALDIEQSVQLWVKHLIFQKAGDFPKIHYFNTLINTLADIYAADPIKNFYKENILQFTSLEDAYLTSRYLPKEFSKEEAAELINFVKDFFKVLEDSINEKFI
jgi:HEPN domain-containing protein